MLEKNKDFLYEILGNIIYGNINDEMADHFNQLVILYATSVENIEGYNPDHYYELIEDINDKRT